MLKERPAENPNAPHGRFIAVAGPCRSDGIGRALQVAFRDGIDLPADIQACLAKLDRIAR